MGSGKILQTSLLGVNLPTILGCSTFQETSKLKFQLITRCVFGLSIVQVAQASINYEVNKTFAMTVKCTDDGLPPLSLSWSFTIAVLNVNEPPTNVSITSGKELVQG